jgi:deoxyadenosine/deoxycytidine kinase
MSDPGEISVWLAIEGVIGAGKTTTTSLIARSTDLEARLERLDEHPFLEAYYRDPAPHAVHTELAFMLMQARQVGEAGRALVTDFAPAKNLVFARLWLDDEDVRFLEQAERRLWRGLQPPDLTVFLDVPPPVCLERLRGRGRVYETDLAEGDLVEIRRRYFASIDSLGSKVKVIELDGSEPPERVAKLVAEIAGLPYSVAAL